MSEYPKTIRYGGFGRRNYLDQLTPYTRSDYIQERRIQNYYKKLNKQREQEQLEKHTQERKAHEEKNREYFKGTPYQIGTNWYSLNDKAKCKIIGYDNGYDNEIGWLVIRTEWHYVEYAKGNRFKTKFTANVTPNMLVPRVVRSKRL